MNWAESVESLYEGVYFALQTLHVGSIPLFLVQILGLGDAVGYEPLGEGAVVIDDFFQRHSLLLEFSHLRRGKCVS